MSSFKTGEKLKFLVAAVTAFLIGIGGLWALWLESKTPNVLSFLTTIFTGFAAIGTAYAAYAASESAKISEKASNIWKQQMSIDIELAEAKELKVCLNDWHRRFTAEAYKKNQTLNELLQGVLESPHAIKQVQIDHFQKYIDDLNLSWSNLESAFDRANFVGHSFEQRLRLRRLHIAHRRALNKYVEYLMFNNRMNLHHEGLIELLTTIYHINDWAQQDVNGQPLYRVEIELIDDNGTLSLCKKDDGTSVYDSLHNSVEGWVLNTNVYVDHKIEEIRSRVIDI
ncbi:hypothetical protein [Photobacterium kagoshimensis]|uniref:hypothetical protein n=1 Tax=Photobacterium kagoshimensis TaxID=2910242 RepID=UPI003D0F2F5F